MSGSTSRVSKMRVPDAMARWSRVYCIVRLRIGSKKRWMYMMNAISRPISIAPPVTMPAPK